MLSRLRSLFRQRQFTKLAQADARADSFGIKPKLNQRGALRVARPCESAVKILGSFDRLAVQAISAGESGKIRVGQHRPADAPGIFTFLMHPDGSVHTVIDHEE